MHRKFEEMENDQTSYQIPRLNNLNEIKDTRPFDVVFKQPIVFCN
jgi:hypothetical protein